MIIYSDSADNVTVAQLDGFFVGWLNPPDPATHLAILKNSYSIWIAIDSEADNRVVGFINAVSDRVLSAYLPLLEVLPDYQKRGIGSELVKRMLAGLDQFYMIDLTCDDNMVKFYEALGLKKYIAMMKRNFERQSGV